MSNSDSYSIINDTLSKHLDYGMHHMNICIINTAYFRIMLKIKLMVYCSILTFMLSLFSNIKTLIIKAHCIYFHQLPEGNQNVQIWETVLPSIGLHIRNTLTHVVIDSTLDAQLGVGLQLSYSAGFESPVSFSPDTIRSRDT